MGCFGSDNPADDIAIAGGDVELLLLDQVQEQVQRPLKDGELDLVGWLLDIRRHQVS